MGAIFHEDSLCFQEDVKLMAFSSAKMGRWKMVIGDETIFNTVVLLPGFHPVTVGREEGEGTTKRQKTNRKRTFQNTFKGLTYLKV